MTTFILIRHGMTDAVGHTIAGRTPGVNLNAAGVAQAERLAAHLAAMPITHIYSSPLERARQTAEPLARATNCEVRISEPFNELDFGAWTNRALAELDPLPEWKAFNARRSTAVPPGGELMLEVQARTVAELERLRALHEDRCVAVVSHADVIRALLAHLLGAPLDLLLRLHLDPATFSVVEAYDEGDYAVRCINCQPS